MGGDHLPSGAPLACSPPVPYKIIIIIILQFHQVETMETVKYDINILYNIMCYSVTNG